MKDLLLNSLLDIKVRYVSIPQTICNWYKNGGKKYIRLSLKEVKNKYKKSGTIFILGGSESINDVTDEQWDHIAKHDSFGMNWWPVHPFVPTFYSTNYPRPGFFSQKPICCFYEYVEPVRLSKKEYFSAESFT